MRIRTQLILAAFVLAVIPLAAIVTYSHHSSKRALETAYQREAERLTGQMDKRLASIRAELDQRLTFVSALPLPSQQSGDAGQFASVMGDAAGLVDALEFHPLPVAHPDPRPTPEPKASVAEAPAAEPVESASATPPAAPQVTVPAVAGVATVAPTPPAPPAQPVVIDIPAAPAFPHYVMSEEQKELIDEVSRLGRELTNQQLSPDERQDLREELRATQKALQQVMAENRAGLVQYARDVQRASREREREEQRISAERERAAQQQAATPASSPSAKEPAVVVRRVVEGEAARSAATAKKTSLLLGRSFEAPVRQEGELVGQLTARIRPEQVIQRLLGSGEDGSELPFAIDREGSLYTRSSDDRATLERLGVPDRVRKGQSVRSLEGWIVSTSTDPSSGLKIGVARPVGEHFNDLRRTAARNFILGLGLIVFAVIGIVPFSNHLTRDVKLVTEGADRIAHGDLMTRLPVKTKNELGMLARAFNRMAEDLSVQQQRLLEQERARKEQEIQQRLLAVEYDRKSLELEDARRFQLSMLPKEVPQHPAFDVAVFTRTATEVGGDYYDFHLLGDTLAVTIGDATGHGAKAGTMVTVIKTLFAGYDAAASPAEFLEDAAGKIKRMDLGRMAMALSLARMEGRRMTVASAGMPPVLVHRSSTGEVEEVALSATPLGTLGTSYDQLDVELASGDTVLFLSDGFPELMSDDGQQLGYTGAIDAFAVAAKGSSAEEVIASLEEQARRWHGEGPPNDDVTFVVVRVA